MAETSALVTGCGSIRYGCGRATDAVAVALMQATLISCWMSTPAAAPEGSRCRHQRRNILSYVLLKTNRRLQK